MKKTKNLGAVSANGTAPALWWNKNFFHVDGTPPANLGRNGTTKFDLVYSWWCYSTCQARASKAPNTRTITTGSCRSCDLADEPNLIARWSQDEEKIPGRLVGWGKIDGLLLADSLRPG